MVSGSQFSLAEEEKKSISVFSEVFWLTWTYEGTIASGLYLPANPILELRDPTSIIKGIPFWWLKPCGIYIIKLQKIIQLNQLLLFRQNIRLF